MERCAQNGKDVHMEQSNPLEKTQFDLKWKRFFSLTGRAIYYNSQLHGLFEQLEKVKSENCFYLYIYNSISNLKNCHWSFACKQTIQSTHVHKLNVVGSEIHYFIDNNIVYISHFILNDLKYIQNVEKNNITGIYFAKRRENKTGFDVQCSIQKVTTLNVAINCGDNNIVELMHFMPKMIVEAHHHLSPLNRQGFSLFYTPGIRINNDEAWLRINDCVLFASARYRDALKIAEDEIVDRLAACMQFVLQQRVDWTILGSGAIIFLKALDKLKAMKRAEGKGLDLSNFGAVFYRPHCRAKTIKVAIKRILGAGSPVDANYLNKDKTEIFTNKIKGSTCQELRARVYKIFDYLFSIQFIVFVGLAYFLSKEYFNSENAQRYIYQISEQLSFSGTTISNALIYGVVLLTAIGLLPKRNHKKNPNFNDAKHFDINFSGNVLHLKAPNHCYDFIEKDKYQRQHYVDIANEKYYVSAFEQDREFVQSQNTDIPEIDSFNLVWTYYKGFFRKDPTVILNFSIKLRKISHKNNLFEPKQFEQAVIDTIDAKFGPYSSLGNFGRRFEVPLNWQHQKVNGLDWLSYTIQELNYGGNCQTQWCTPITQQHFLSFEFNEAAVEHSAAARNDIDKLITKIISSCNIDFSDKVQQFRSQAQQQTKSPHFSHSRKPRYWTIYDDDPEQFMSHHYRSVLQLQRDLIAYNQEQQQNKYIGLARPTIDEQFEIRRTQARQLRQELGLQVDLFLDG